MKFSKILGKWGHRWVVELWRYGNAAKGEPRIVTKHKYMTEWELHQLLGEK